MLRCSITKYTNGELLRMKVTHKIITWEDRLKLGIPLVDSQHEHLIQITNNLHLACQRDTATANNHFIHTAHEAVRYVRYHFYTEEQLMLRFGFPEFSSHKKEHDVFSREVLKVTKNFSGEKRLVPNRFVAFLKEWVLSHIPVCDREMTEFIIGEAARRKKLAALSA